MHAIEKDIMNNPLESDALDGFEMFAPASIENDLNTLKTRIERKTGYSPETNVISSKQFIRIAAIALVVLFSTTIVILLTRNSDKVLSPTLSDNSLREMVTPPMLDSQNDSIEIETDSNNIIEDIEIAEEAKSSAKLNNETSKPRATKTKISVIELDTNELDLTESLSPKTVSVKKSESIKPTSTIEPLLLLEEEVVAEKNVAKTEIIENQVSVMAVQEANIKMEEISSSPTLEKSVSATTHTASDKAESAVSAMPPRVMTQYVATIKNAALNDVPELEGEFEVWFNVDMQGNMDSFDVSKSLGRKNDRKIIRIIENQGKWTPAYKNSKPIESIAVIQIDFTKK